ncbi:MAG: hypothetical protein DRI56_13595 [Chloroflexota bacterium]|nr:MAG: hypothetical protein B6243_11100 [Anaerolineaceae bacterium 4572_5.2]RLD02787.1 MAG: hypothetical protein DRI56_13595 [Chloroflexota bacterium]
MVEEIINTTPSSEDVTDDDKLWGMLSWLPFVGWILAIIALVIEPQKNRTYIRNHAVQSLAANVILGLISVVLGLTVVLSCVAPFLSLVLIYPAIKAYQGEELEIAIITDFCKNQGWI